MDSWSPSGVYKEYIISIAGLFQESTWIPSGVLIKSMWTPGTPCGVNMESMWSPGTLCGVNMEYIWTPYGHHQEFIRSIRSIDGVQQDVWGSVNYTTNLLTSPGSSANIRRGI